MEEMAKKVVYFKTNVPYSVSVRFSSTDSQGYMLDRKQPWVAVPSEGLREFKMANKRFLMDGIIIETGEPSVDWDTPNALVDEDIDELLKNYLKLKSTVAEVTSVAIIAKILERAKDQNKSGKTISLIQSRLDELSENEEMIAPREMRGVS